MSGPMAIMPQAAVFWGGAITGLWIGAGYTHPGS
jgi:hypothetical protein